MNLNPLSRLYRRLQLSRAKHPSLTGHPRIARRLARIPRTYEYSLNEAWGIDGAPSEVVLQRQEAFVVLSQQLLSQSPASLSIAHDVRAHVPDAEFVHNHRVPFQFRTIAQQHLPVVSVVSRTAANELHDADGNTAIDIGGSYGVNLFGTTFYKDCMRRAVERVGETGLVLGPHHSLVADNARRICDVSGMDGVSFHMSGTEAVMQAVRLARYHTGRSHVVRFAGAYHGWWDGVQAGPGNPRPSREVYTLAEMSERTLGVLRTRDDIACVLVNPIQAMHPNAAPPSDATLVMGERHAAFDKEAYQQWLQRLRQVCTERGIVLIFDEIFLGFRLARGGVQEYFGVRADLVTYGKSLGGGFPVGVVAGKRGLMKRFDDERPGNVCLARGTFNAHPYVMAAMNEFLQHIDTPQVRSHYAAVDEVWNRRAGEINHRLAILNVPVRIANMTSVWCMTFHQPGRYNWLLQYYLRAEGLSMSWIGTGRFIFSHDLTDAQIHEVSDRIVRAVERMRDGGWWWMPQTVDPRTRSRHVKRQLMRELLRAWMGQKP
ncbi:MAG: aminotransferase class III-fold pyridoxal phosphate-dependent enzyme [Gemmatimonas sp.]